MRFKQWRLRPEEGGKFMPPVDARIGLMSPGGIAIPPECVTEDNEGRLGSNGKFMGHKVGDQVVCQEASDKTVYTVVALVPFGEPAPTFAEMQGLATEDRVWCSYKDTHRCRLSYVWATPKYWRRYIRV